MSSTGFRDCYCCSVTQSYLTLCNPMDCSTPGFPVLHHLLECAQTHDHWVDDVIQPSHPLSPPSSAFNLSNELAFHMRWPKYWSFSISPSNEYSGLISFRIDIFYLLAVPSTLKSLLQHSSRTSILWRSAFFTVPLSHPYMTTRKTIALTKWTLVGKVMSLVFNTLSRFVIVLPWKINYHQRHPSGPVVKPCASNTGHRFNPWLEN